MKEVCPLDKINRVSKGHGFGCYIPSNALILLNRCSVQTVSYKGGKELNGFSSHKHSALILFVRCHHPKRYISRNLPPQVNGLP